ncbi:hypothetical protein FVE85_1066 [Porphyridium purpureum]|uniref:Uncharacterized protein n=1 Tax=Porphyridium purpureum TaxID=35688 RepID=A0A5J4Z3W1_PORPP|nr:hypothetical protein FVE85_1066 [Porphyridium purpureum]|eukprot:POR7976..scf208_2
MEKGAPSGPNVPHHASSTASGSVRMQPAMHDTLTNALASRSAQSHGRYELAMWEIQQATLAHRSGTGKNETGPERKAPQSALVRSLRRARRRARGEHGEHGDMDHDGELQRTRAHLEREQQGHELGVADRGGDGPGVVGEPAHPTPTYRTSHRQEQSRDRLGIFAAGKRSKGVKCIEEEEDKQALEKSQVLKQIPEAHAAAGAPRTCNSDPRNALNADLARLRTSGDASAAQAEKVRNPPIASVPDIMSAPIRVAQKDCNRAGPDSDHGGRRRANTIEGTTRVTTLDVHHPTETPGVFLPLRSTVRRAATQNVRLEAFLLEPDYGPQEKKHPESPARERPKHREGLSQGIRGAEKHVSKPAVADREAFLLGLTWDDGE